MKKWDVIFKKIEKIFILLSILMCIVSYNIIIFYHNNVGDIKTRIFSCIGINMFMFKVFIHEWKR